MDRTVTAVVDPEKCIGCGLCVEVCPLGTLPMADGKAVVTGDMPLSCGHCAAACPADAVRIGITAPSYSDLQNVRAWNSRKSKNSVPKA